MFFFFFKQKTAYEMRISDWSSDVCSSDLGIVCSGNEVAAAKARWHDGFFVVPGVRLEGSAMGDQKRVMTPRAARDAGASILVVGRPITQADDPDGAARAIAATL